MPRAYPLIYLKPRIVVLNIMIAVEFRQFLFSIYVVVFFRFLNKNINSLLNGKKSQHGILKVWC
jgi:hypothetical protein